MRFRAKIAIQFIIFAYYNPLYRDKAYTPEINVLET
jgi:hypothetical protein